MRLGAPKQITWIVALILGVAGILGLWWSFRSSPRLPFGYSSRGVHCS
jgi:hypothetical protein